MTGQVIEVAHFSYPNDAIPASGEGDANKLENTRGGEQHMEPADQSDAIKEALDETLETARALQSDNRSSEAAGKFEQASELMLRFANCAVTEAN